MDIQEYSEIIFHNLIGNVSTMFSEHSLLWTHTHTHSRSHKHFVPWVTSSRNTARILVSILMIRSVWWTLHEQQCLVCSGLL